VKISEIDELVYNVSDLVFDVFVNECIFFPSEIYPCICTTLEETTFLLVNDSSRWETLLFQ